MSGPRTQLANYHSSSGDVEISEVYKTHGSFFKMLLKNLGLDSYTILVVQKLVRVDKQLARAVYPRTSRRFVVYTYASLHHYS